MIEKNHLNEEKIKLTDDKVVFLSNQISKSIGSLDFLRSQLKDLKVSTKFNALSLAYSYLNSVGKELNHKEDIDQSREATLFYLKKANEKIENLENKIIKNTSSDNIGYLIASAEKYIRKWWYDNHFSYCTGTFSAWADNEIRYKADLRCRLDLHDGYYEENPVTRKNEFNKRKELLKSLGLELRSIDNESNDIKDTEISKKYLTDMIMNKFPGSTIHKISSYHKENDFYIDRIEVSIKITPILKEIQCQ